MNVRRFAAVTALLISPIALSALPVAPVAAPDAASAVSFGPHLWTSRDIAQVTGKPFSATRTTKHEATAADGSSVTHEISTKIMRDSSGRVRQETPIIHQPDGKADPSNVAVQVYDPAARTILSWTTRGTTATLIHLPQQVVTRTAAATSSRDVESLGSQSVNNFEAEGQRIQQVVSADSGDKEPATVVTETWTSSDLKVPVRQTITDPRHGTTTAELTDISQDEPDAALFEAPAGYTVRDLTPSAATVVAAQ